MTEINTLLEKMSRAIYPAQWEWYEATMYDNAQLKKRSAFHQQQMATMGRVLDVVRLSDPVIDTAIKAQYPAVIPAGAPPQE